ncbi:MAG TPA: hypothetical protein VFW30_12310 [Bryocella sp.]|nr:hypothetical protein [Bryocella sp.]
MALAQMPSPSMDRDSQPFSYFANPTDQIGVAGAPSATEITPEGFLYTGFGELMFFVGSDWAPLTPTDGPRTRTLEDGYLPVQTYEVRRDGLTYRFTMFSASLGRQPEGDVADFVRITISNHGSEPRAAFLSTAVRFQAPQLAEGEIADNRFRRPAVPEEEGGYSQPGEKFSKDWIYSFEGNAFVRDGRVLYLFPQDPAPVLAHTLYRRYNRRPISTPGKLDIQPTTPAGVATYDFVLPPGSSRSLDFKMPLLPAAKNSQTIRDLQAASFDDFHARVRAYWQKVVAQGMTINVPEAKADNLFRACLVNDLLALNHIGSDWIQTVNQTHYHSFYLRDSSDFVHMYDVTGYPKMAERVLDFYARKQQPDGNFLSQKGQFDGWGQTLWIYGFHERFTHDRAFAQRVFPSVLRAADWFEKVTADDPLHLMPATDVRDNEFIPGHLTGYNFLALDGLQGSVALANALGRKEDAALFQKDYDTLRAHFLPILDARSAANGGAIPPALDGDNGGADWGNLLSVVPEPQLDPHDSKVTATLHHTQSHYAEGLIVFNQPGQGRYIHHYLTIKNTLTEVVRGDQEQALKEFYSLLLHTSSTQSGFEYAIRPWGSRDFQGNLSPHGWFAAEYRNLMRSMMLREQDDRSLHLLSVISPDWIGVGKSISVSHAPTMFGEVSFTLNSTSNSHAVLQLQTAFGPQLPDHLYLHLPWFMQVKSVVADGRSVRPVDGIVELPRETELVDLTWTRRGKTPAMSYAQTVKDYKRDYAAHYSEYLRTGSPFAQ